MKIQIYELVGKLRLKYHKKINDTYIWTSIASSAIEEASTNDEFLAKVSIQVPSSSKKVKTKTKTKTIKRTQDDLSNIFTSASKVEFNHAILTFLVAQVEAFFYDFTSASKVEFNHAILTFLVAQVEAFFYDLIYGILMIDKRRLKTKINGINHIKTINVESIINAESLDEILKDLIEQELISIFYASPEKQFEYMSKILGIEFDQKINNLFDKWKEYKATRDIIVHNSGLINETYIKKSANQARGEIGDQLIIDNEYLNFLIADTKSLIGKITSNIQKNNKS